MRWPIPICARWLMSAGFPLKKESRASSQISAATIRTVALVPLERDSSPNVSREIYDGSRLEAAPDSDDAQIRAGDADGSKRTNPTIESESPLGPAGSDSPIAHGHREQEYSNSSFVEDHMTFASVPLGTSRSDSLMLFQGMLSGVLLSMCVAGVVTVVGKRIRQRLGIYISQSSR
eukprot:282953-Pyramimonas_sp.AAC.1